MSMKKKLVKPLEKEMKNVMAYTNETGCTKSNLKNCALIC